MKIKLESAELPETEVIIRGDVTSKEVVSLLQLLKMNTPGGNRQVDRVSPTPIPLKSYTLSASPTPPV